MARPVSQRVKEVRSLLEVRLRDGLHRPGDRFLSNRSVAQLYGVSYQTAQRLLSELVDAGLLTRRVGAGTYMPGEEHSLCGVELLFHARAKRPGSFGAKLLMLLSGRLDRLGVDTVTRLVDLKDKVTLQADRLPVVWEVTAAIEQCAVDRRQAVILNDRPASGFAATHIDSVSVDDFSGGACAAQMMSDKRRPVVFAGPQRDARSQQRVAGFLALRKTPVVYAGGWYVEEGLSKAESVFKMSPDAVFCCNDRLAEALVRSNLWKAGKRPMLVGFDDAPIAAILQLNTIAIPWTELVNAALRTINLRLTGDRSAAIRQVVAPQPVRRQ